MAEGGGEGGGGELQKILSGDVAPEENPFQHPAVIACDWVAFIAVSGDSIMRNVTSSAQLLMGPGANSCTAPLPASSLGPPGWRPLPRSQHVSERRSWSRRERGREPLMSVARALAVEASGDNRVTMRFTCASC